MKRGRLFALLGLACMLRTAAAQEAAKESKTMWKHEVAAVNGLKLHYVTLGQGKTVLFLHGFPEFWYAWKEQLAEFGKDHQAVAVDMRGYNLSDKPKKVEEYAISLLVADVKALLDTLSPGKRAILVGHDWGGAIAWAFAAAHPDYLEKLVIINAPHPTIFARELQSSPAQQKASGYMNLFRSAQAESILSANKHGALVTGVFGSARPGAFSEEARKTYLEAWAQPGALTGGLNYYRAARLGPPARLEPAPDAKPDPSILASLPPIHVKVPTLVIWGEKDTALLTGNLDGLDKFVPHLKIQRIPNGTHWVVHEEPETINRAIREFLAEQPKK